MASIGADEMTWERMLEIEPTLAAIMAEADKVPGGPNLWPVYSAFKRRLSMLVGWDARNPLLSDCSAYDLAISKLCDALQI